MVHTGPLTLEELITHTDKLYFDKKACRSAFLKGFILGSVSVLAFLVLAAAAGWCAFSWCIEGLHG